MRWSSQDGLGRHLNYTSRPPGRTGCGRAADCQSALQSLTGPLWPAWTRLDPPGPAWARLGPRSVFFAGAEAGDEGERPGNILGSPTVPASSRVKESIQNEKCKIQNLEGHESNWVGRDGPRNDACSSAECGIGARGVEASRQRRPTRCGPRNVGCFTLYRLVPAGTAWYRVEFFLGGVSRQASFGTGGVATKERGLGTRDHTSPQPSGFPSPPRDGCPFIRWTASRYVVPVRGGEGAEIGAGRGGAVWPDVPASGVPYCPRMPTWDGATARIWPPMDAYARLWSHAIIFLRFAHSQYQREGILACKAASHTPRRG